MYLVNLNNVTIKVVGQTVNIIDRFGDLSQGEIQVILKYLANEGFIDKKKNVSLNIESKPIACIKKKNGDKK